MVFTTSPLIMATSPSLLPAAHLPIPFKYNRQFINDPDTIRPTLAGYSLEKFGKGVQSVCCVLNPKTGNTNTLVGGGDGTVSFVNQSLNKVKLTSIRQMTVATLKL